MDADAQAYARSADHFRHAPGAPVAPEWNRYAARLPEELARTADPTAARVQTDRAWVVMLCRQGLIERATAARILRALADAPEEAGGGEWGLREQLGGDQDTASVVNYGRTAQEPMSRLQLRDKLLDVLGLVLDALDVVLSASEKHAALVMAGHSHLSHAQPTTYGAYLLAIHDGLSRGLDRQGWSPTVGRGRRKCSGESARRYPDAETEIAQRTAEKRVFNPARKHTLP